MLKGVIRLSKKYPPLAFSLFLVVGSARVNLKQLTVTMIPYWLSSVIIGRCSRISGSTNARYPRERSS